MDKRLFLILILASVPLDSKAQNIPNTQAIKTSEPIKIDGILDEPAWQNVPANGNFIQREPFLGQAASEKTEFKILYDDDYLYVGITLFDQDASGIVGRIRKFDSDDLYYDDYVSVNIDPQHDRRTVYSFVVNPIGGEADAKGIGNGNFAVSTWDAVWYSKVKVGAEGWVVEMKIPFSTLEYDPVHNAELGINISRQIARKTELDDWAAIRPPLDSYHASEYGTLSGIEISNRSWRHLSFLPSLAIGFQENKTNVDGIVPANSRDFVLNPGFDLKYPLKRNAIGQLTFRTDFSQVDIDDFKPNLNRFSLFFPEKRPFFLEGASNFDFGVAQSAQLFFSRRIGLEGGLPIPILAGVRSYGKIGGSEYGFLNIETESQGAVPSRNFTVARFRQDILERSEVGGIIVHRQDTENPTGRNTAGGVDAVFRSSDNRFVLTTFVAGTNSEPKVIGDITGNGASGYVKGFWNNKSWDLTPSIIYASDQFDPKVGFYQQTGIFRPRLLTNRRFLLPEKGIKRLTLTFDGWTYFSDEVNELNDIFTQGGFSVDTNNGYSIFAYGYYLSDDVLAPFDLKQGVTIAPGRYNSQKVYVKVTSPFNNAISGGFGYLYGGFFGGKIHTVEPFLRFKIIPNLNLFANTSVNLIQIPASAPDYFSTFLNVKASYDITESMTFDTNGGWNQDRNNLNLQYRFRWRFAPLSDLFLVYEEQRTASNFSLAFQSFICKMVFDLVI